MTGVPVELDRPNPRASPHRLDARARGGAPGRRAVRAALRLVPLAFSLAASIGLIGPAAADPAGFEPYWVQNHRETMLWSGPDDRAIPFGPAPQWSYFQVVRPQQGLRLYVLVAASGNYAWIDAPAVGPSGPPPAPGSEPASDDPDALPLIPLPQPEYRPTWVATHLATDLWSGPESTARREGQAAPGEYFLVLEPQRGPRLRVLVQATRKQVWIDALAVGPVPPPVAAELPAEGWRGVVTVDLANVRPEPNTWIAPIGRLRAGAEVTVEAWVEGDEVVEDQPVWAKLGDGQYVWSGLLARAGPRQPEDLLAAVPPLPEGLVPHAGRWIDVNLSAQTITAYEGEQPVYAALVSSGRPGWSTSTGRFWIKRRVERETMDASTLLALDAAGQRRADYRVENVRWTQYFTDDGQALHENYWRPAALFGLPSSHGCLGLLARDAEWFWHWADLGTPLEIHF